MVQGRRNTVSEKVCKNKRSNTTCDDFLKDFSYSKHRCFRKGYIIAFKHSGTYRIDSLYFIDFHSDDHRILFSKTCDCENAELDPLEVWILRIHTSFCIAKKNCEIRY